MAEPLIRNLPDATQAFINKFDKLGPTLSRLPPPVANSLVDFDLQRVNRGQPPVSIPKTGKLLQTALTGQPATPPPTRGTSPLDVVGNFFGDIRDIGLALPSLPRALVREVTDLPQIPRAIAQGEGNILARTLAAPGIRMVPGAFVGEAIARGEPSEILRHPGFAALDVAPFAARPGARFARQAGQRFAATPVGQDVMGSRLVRTAQRAFGQQAREVARPHFYAEQRMRERLKGEGDEAGLAEVDILAAKKAREFTEKYKDQLPEERIEELTRIGKVGDPNVEVRFNPGRQGDVERAFLSDWQSTVDDLANAALERGDLERVTLSGTPEIVTPQQARQFHRSQTTLTRVEDIAIARREVANPTLDPPTLIDRVTRTLRHEDFPRAHKRRAAEAYAHALNARGFDADGALKAARGLRNKTSAVDDVVREFDRLREQSPVFATPSAQRIADGLRKLTDPADVRMQRLIGAIENNNWQGAARLANALKKRKTLNQPFRQGLEEVTEIARRRREADKFFNRREVRNLDDRLLKQVERQQERIQRRTIPARFQQPIEEAVAARMLERPTVKVRGEEKLVYNADPNIPEIADLLRNRHYQHPSLGLDGEAFRRLVGDISRSWTDMKQAGFDPVFLHRVSPNAVNLLERPRIDRVPLSQVKERVRDFTPHVEDATVAVSHQAVEFLARRGFEEFATEILDKHGRNVGQLTEEYLPAARVRAQARNMDERTALKELIEKDYAPFNKTPFSEFRTTRFDPQNVEQLMVPRNVADVARELIEPKRGAITSTLDPVMQTFRVSVLALSPRWHVYNMVGGAISIFARTGPSVFKHLKQARQMLNDGTLPDDVRLSLGAVGDMQLDWTSRAGRQMGNWMSEGMRERLAPLSRAGGKVVEKSFKANAFVDDLYRTMSYLYGYDKALTRGMTREAAEKAGIELSRKVLQDWASYTPFERTVAKSIMPFYSWVGHILRYVSSYPVDHPIRTSIMSSLVEAELEDFGDDLPKRLLSSFMLGEPDEDGNVASIQLGGLNPFSDVASLGTLSGYVAALNPVINTGLEALGIDTLSGKAELYPDITYDAESGRITPKTGLNIPGAIGNFIPQARILTALTGTSNEYKEIARTNPAAARRMLQSAAGIPLLHQEINLHQEQFKAELARQEAESAAFRDAQQAGDVGAAGNWPGLRPAIEQIEALQGTGALQQFQPLSEDELRAITQGGRATGQVVGEAMATPAVHRIEQAQRVLAQRFSQ